MDLRHCWKFCACLVYDQKLLPQWHRRGGQLFEACRQNLEFGCGGLRLWRRRSIRSCGKIAAALNGGRQAVPQWLPELVCGVSQAVCFFDDLIDLVHAANLAQQCQRLPDES